MTGQKVVCITEPPVGIIQPDGRRYGSGDEAYPLIGKEYTIRHVINYPDGTQSILLNEIVNSVRTYYGGYNGEIQFHSRHFRVVRETDISIFTKMLDPVEA